MISSGPNARHRVWEVFTFTFQCFDLVTPFDYGTDVSLVCCHTGV